jgi:hypothetical protein
MVVVLTGVSYMNHALRPRPLRREREAQTT